jgi:hypothetical protein
MTNCNKGTTIFYCNGSFHRPFPKSASCSAQSGVELPRIASPPPHPSLHVSAFLGRNPHLYGVLTHSVPSRDHHHYTIIPPVQSRTPHLSRRASSSRSVSLSTVTCRHRCQHSLRKKRRHRTDNSHKAHPRSRSGNRIRPQHANTVDEG